jgi:hypothetical protein
MKPWFTVLFFWNPKSCCAHFGFFLYTFVSRKCYLKITWCYYPCYTVLEAGGDTFSKLAQDPAQPATTLKWDKLNSMVSSPQANYSDRATATCRRS